MNKLNQKHFLVLWLTAILFISASLGMEKFEKQVSPSIIKSPIKYLSGGEFPSTPFYCMSSQKTSSSLELMTRRSNLIRKTVIEIHRCSSSDSMPTPPFLTSLHESVSQCLEICNNCDHPATGLFRKQAKLLTTVHHKQKPHSTDIRKAIAKSFQKYYVSLQKKGDLDIIDLRLMIQLILGEFAQKEVFEKVKILSVAKRDEIAIYYLMNFALFTHFSREDPSLYYHAASKLGCTEAKNALLEIETDADALRAIMCHKSDPIAQSVKSSDEEGYVELLDSSS